MKKIFISGILLFTFYSCTQENIQVANKSEAQKVNKSESAIEQAEEAIGQKLFKKEVEFKDASGKNSVKFRFAGYDEKSIDNYLSQYEIGIKPLTKKDKEEIKNRAVSKTIKDSQSSTSSKEIDFSGIAVDFVSKNLEQDYIGYMLTLEFKTSSNVKNSKVNYGFCDVSWMNWPEMVIIENSSPYFGFGFDFLGASYWWTGYSFRFSDAVPKSTIGYFEYDGPWRSKVCTNGGTSNITISWVSW